MNSEGYGSVALETECIARTLVRLGDSVKAKQNAEESLRLYKLEVPSPVINQSIRRVEDLIRALEEEKGQLGPA
jgi:hypothetical protein